MKASIGEAVKAEVGPSDSVAPVAAPLPAVAEVLGLQRSHGNAATQRILARRAAEATTAPQAERVVDVPAGTEIYHRPKKVGKPEAINPFRQPVALIGLVNVDVAPGVVQGYWVASMAGRQVYIKQEALAGSVASMLEEWRAKDDDPSLGNRGTRLRELILEELKPFVAAGKVIERTDMFRQIVSDADLDVARAGHQTTCILFQGRIISNAASKLNAERGVKVALDKNKQAVVKDGYMGDVNVSTKGTIAKSRASMIGHGMQRTADQTGRFAWWEATTSMPRSRRPKPGDIYVLHKNENRAEFSHVGFFLGHEVEGDHEIWHTMDGGQGVARQKQEAFEVRHRKYIPGTNLIEGEPNQSDKYRWVLGWVDVDQLEKSPAPKEDAQAAAFKG